METINKIVFKNCTAKLILKTETNIYQLLYMWERDSMKKLFLFQPFSGKRFESHEGLFGFGFGSEEPKLGVHVRQTGLAKLAN